MYGRSLACGRQALLRPPHKPPKSAVVIPFQAAREAGRLDFRTSGPSPSRPVQSRNRLPGSGTPETIIDPEEANAPLKTKTPPAKLVPKNPVPLVQARFPQDKYENTVPGGLIGVVVKEE